MFLSLYSLEKLIEWKQIMQIFQLINYIWTLYSLEKLIEWKLKVFAEDDALVSLLSTR